MEIVLILSDHKIGYFLVACQRMTWTWFSTMCETGFCVFDRNENASCIDTDIETDRALQCQRLGGKTSVIRLFKLEQEPCCTLKLPVKTIYHLGVNVSVAFSWLQRK
jgi:hypothetical protein